MTADSTAAAPTRAAAPTERWGLVRADHWDAHGRDAYVIPYRSSTSAGRSAGAQNKHIRATGMPDSRLLLVVRGLGDRWAPDWQVAWDPRDGGTK